MLCLDSNHAKCSTVTLRERVSDSYNHPNAVAVAPFFQIVKVIDAIFRARVRRAIAGLLPLARSPA
jgi:hypothetical protein